MRIHLLTSSQQRLHIQALLYNDVVGWMNHFVLDRTMQPLAMHNTAMANYAVDWLFALHQQP